MTTTETKDGKGDTDPTLDEIGRKYAEYNYGRTSKDYSGGDKTTLGQCFTLDYDTLFTPMRYQKVQLLELGVLQGKSLAMWSEYFVNGSVYGIDRDLKRYESEQRELKKHGFDADKVHVFQADVTNADEMKRVIEKLPTLDIIIDDALHKADAQWNNFRLLFDKLGKGGYYVVEDVTEAAAFWDAKRFGGLLGCVVNPGLASKTRQHPDACASAAGVYSLGMHVDSIIVKKNFVAIRRKAKPC